MIYWLSLSLAVVNIVPSLTSYADGINVCGFYFSEMAIYFQLV